MGARHGFAWSIGVVTNWVLFSFFLPYPWMTNLEYAVSCTIFLGSSAGHPSLTRLSTATTLILADGLRHPNSSGLTLWPLSLQK